MHVGFDMDGVLLDSESDLSWLDRALDATLAAFDVAQTEENRHRLYPPNLRNFEAAAAALGVPVEELWPVRQRHYVREKERAIREETIGPFDDIDELHDLATDAHLSIISNSPKPVVETFVDVADLTQIIDHVIGRGSELDAIEHMKPATTFYTRLQSEATTNPTVYVGDSRSDALFAQRTGMDFVHLDRDTGPIRSLEEAIARIQDRS